MSRQSHNPALTGKFPRLSDRFSVDDLEITWLVPNNRKLFSKKPAKVDMTVVDLSVAGALVVGPKLDVIKSGSKMQFVHEGEQGVAEIRHIRPAEDVPGMKNATYYGMVFININDELKRLIFERMAATRGHRPPELDRIWETAK